jgi:uncharacterized protein (DUF362 family)
MFGNHDSRRQFIKKMLGGAGSVMALGALTKDLKAEILALPPRTGLPNPYVMPDGRPILVCVTGTDFQAMLNAGLSAIGGLSPLINNNQDVLIKINCVIAEAYPTCTDPNTIDALVRAVRPVTTGQVKVGDQGYDNIGIVYQFMGYEPIVTAAGGELVYFLNTYNVRRNGWDPAIPDFSVYSEIYDAPIMISLCNLKRHLWSYFTCALKHHVGSITGPYLAGTRSYIHSFPHFSHTFLQIMAELGGLINPELNVVDGRQIWAINGPTSQQGGEIRTINKMVICGDMVATDAYCSQLMDQFDETYDPSWISPTLDHAVSLGLGRSDLTQVEIIEIDLTSVDEKPNGAPNKFTLRQNYPNPFNASTNIEFEIQKSSHVTVDISDNLGRRVHTLFDGDISAGSHRLNWNAGDRSSGVYFYNVRIGHQTKSKKMMLVK